MPSSSHTNTSPEPRTRLPPIRGRPSRHRTPTPQPQDTDHAHTAPHIHRPKSPAAARGCLMQGRPSPSAKGRRPLSLLIYTHTLNRYTRPPPSPNPNAIPPHAALTSLRLPRVDLCPPFLALVARCCWPSLLLLVERRSRGTKRAHHHWRAAARRAQRRREAMALAVDLICCGAVVWGAGGMDG